MMTVMMPLQMTDPQGIHQVAMIQMTVLQEMIIIQMTVLQEMMMIQVKIPTIIPKTILLRRVPRAVLRISQDNFSEQFKA
jgi:hypothetical protein